jgi:thiol-disulfide isomerase/thioredoxin
MQSEPPEAYPPKRKRRWLPFSHLLSRTQSFPAHQCSHGEPVMIRLSIVLGLICGTHQIALCADRLADVEKLVGEYKSAERAFFEAPWPDKPTTAESIRAYEAWPGWRHIPRFVELAEAKPDDEAAFRCCQWIIDRTRNVANEDKRIFDADQKAWMILAAHHTEREDLPMLCCEAVQYFGTARERFLRRLVGRKDLSREKLGFATAALAELLAHSFDYCEDLEPPEHPSPRDEYVEFLERKRSPEWGKDLVRANAPKFKAESIQLFRDVLRNYGDVPITISAPYFRVHKYLGEKANTSLHALEHLTLGSESPQIVGKDLHGQPLNLHDYRGNVVVISVWFTGCGPCMGMIPQEKRLIETYKKRPFALLSVCADESLEQAQKTAAEEKMDWPCWFDGKNGPISHDWNVLGFPTIYVLDKSGRIAGKSLRGKELDAKVAELIEEKK